MDLKPQKSNAIKVLIVDDSAFMRRILTDLFESDGSIVVVGTANDGKDALNKIASLNPDVITLDVEMPVMDGISCLKEIMRTVPKPVIMLSSVTQHGTELTIKALDEGAVDFIAKPQNIFDIKNDFLKKEIISKVLVSKNVKFKSLPKKLDKNDIFKETTRNNELKSIIAIGTSTGGPKALQSVIPVLPGNIPAAVLIVQHMPPGFTKSLADRLDSKSGLKVKEAEHKEKLLAGYAYIAPGDYHMKFELNSKGDVIINLDKSPPVNGHRPAVDVMMSSLSSTGLKNIMGVIMTGMGSDGSKGIKLLKEVNKSYIVAQDEETCVVYGMPKMAVQTGAVDKVVSLDKISEEIIQYLGVR